MKIRSRKLYTPLFSLPNVNALTYMNLILYEFDIVIAQGERSESKAESHFWYRLDHG